MWDEVCLGLVRSSSGWGLRNLRIVVHEVWKEPFQGRWASRELVDHVVDLGYCCLDVAAQIVVEADLSIREADLAWEVHDLGP